MERKDFRPDNNFSSGMSDADRKQIQKNKERQSMERGQKEKIPRGDYQPLAVGDKKSIGSKRSDEVNNSFINGESRGKAHDNLHTDGKHLYSYDTVIATRQSDGTFVLNKTKYSATTNKQQQNIQRALESSGKKFDVTGGKDYGYEGEDFSTEVKDEKAGAEHYEKLAKENPEHKDTLNRMADNEREHAKKLKEIETRDVLGRTPKELDYNREHDSRKYVNGEDRTYKPKSKKEKSFMNVDKIIAWENGEMTQAEEKRWFQQGVDSGEVWHLQGMYGRRAKELLDSGEITHSTKETKDYYGNPIKIAPKESKKLYYDRDKNGVSISELSESQQKQYSPNAKVRYVVQKGDARVSVETLDDAKKQQKIMNRAYIDQNSNMTKIAPEESKKPFPVKHLIASDNELDAISRGVAPEVYTHTYGTSKVSDQHKFEARKELQKRDGKNNSITHKEYLRRGYDKDEKVNGVTIEPTYVPRGGGNNPQGGKKDLHYKIKEWGYVFLSKASAEKYAREHKSVNGIIVKKHSRNTPQDRDIFSSQTNTRHKTKKFKEIEKKEQKDIVNSHYNKKYPKGEKYNHGDIEVEYQRENKSFNENNKNQLRGIVFDNRDKSVHDYYGKNKKEVNANIKKDYPKESKKNINGYKHSRNTPLDRDIFSSQTNTRHKTKKFKEHPIKSNAKNRSGKYFSKKGFRKYNLTDGEGYTYISTNHKKSYDSYIKKHKIDKKKIEKLKY